MPTILTAICRCGRDLSWDWADAQYRHTDTGSLYCPDGGPADPQPGTEEATECDEPAGERRDGLGEGPLNPSPSVRLRAL